MPLSMQDDDFYHETQFRHGQQLLIKEEKKLTDVDPLLSYLQEELDHAHTWTLGNPSEFKHRHCYLDDTLEWCPSVSSYHRRAPRFMIIGEKKAGTTSLFQSLARHHNIIIGEAKELLFYTQAKFDVSKYGRWKGDGSASSRLDYRIDVNQTRHDYQQLFKIDTLQQNQNLVTFDASPEYLFNFAVSPKAILCAHPWIKLVVILRHPTSRIWSHYNFIKDALPHHLFPWSFHEWAQKSVDVMKDLGLLRTGNIGSNDTTVLTKQQLHEAWYQYRNRDIEGPAGRGVYALTLNEWFAQLRAIGRDPKDAVRIVRLEDLKKGGPVAAQILQELAEWVRVDKDSSLSNNTVDYAKAFWHGMKTNYTNLGNPKLSPSMKKIWDTFYKPYNNMLAKLLGDVRWNYHNQLNDKTDAPLVWPPSKDDTVKSLFASSSNEVEGPCPS
jgi:hypothetical protein